MSVDFPSPAAEHQFVCGLCGKSAGHLRLFGEADAGQLDLHSFTSRQSIRVGAEDFERIRRRLTAGDIVAIHAIDSSLAPSYCPVCRVCYCADHWMTWDVFDDDHGFTWHDSIRGRCPRGHERMLED